jgi:hypothetical protein
MAFSTRVATMPHDVAVPEYSADYRRSIGEGNRSRLLVALELRHRALFCGAVHRRHPTRIIPFPRSERIALPQDGRCFVRSGNPVVIA